MDQSLQRQKQWVKQSAPPFENAFKVRTDRFDEKRHDNNKEASLNGICVHVRVRDSKHRRDWRKGRFSATSGPSTKKIVATVALRLMTLRSLLLENRNQS